MKTIEIKKIETFEELLKLEDEIYKHACNLDTLFYREIMQITYGMEVHLLISDLAWNFVIAEIKVEDVDKDPNLIDWLKRKYDDPNDWTSFFTKIPTN